MQQFDAPLEPEKSETADGNKTVCNSDTPSSFEITAENAMRTADFPAWKRILDLAYLIIAAPLLIPLMLLIACFIRIVSPGPVVFKQERVGFKRRRFSCLKFRTMKVNADTVIHENHLKQLMQSNQPMIKIDRNGDSRLIPWGAFLRSCALDELPQVFNILRGEMSLVGPRPCTVYEFDNYPAEYYPRFETPPGLTGLWQVCGKNHTTFSEMIKMDIQYARHKSWWLDLHIMLKTFSTLMMQINELRLRKAGLPCPMPKFTRLINCGCCHEPLVSDDAENNQNATKTKRRHTEATDNNERETDALKTARISTDTNQSRRNNIRQEKTASSRGIKSRRVNKER